jgi:glutathione S-transferase
MLKLYGRVRSRAPRCLWAAEEAGIEYQHIPTDHREGEASTPEFLAINPNGRIPTMVDGDLVLCESMAINLYLAQKYGGALWPASDADQALATQWSFWAMTEIEPSIIKILVQFIRVSEEDRDFDVIKAADEDMQRPLKVLEAHLADRDYLLGSSFTIADINLGSVMALAEFMPGFYDQRLTNYPKVAGWLKQRCLGRPAYEKIMQE